MVKVRGFNIDVITIALAVIASALVAFLVIGICKADAACAGADRYQACLNAYNLGETSAAQLARFH